MKTLAAIAFGALSMLFSTTALAQFYVGGGAASSIHIMKTEGVDGKEFHAHNGFYVRGGYDIPIAGNVVLSPGVYYSYQFADMTYTLDVDHASADNLGDDWRKLYSLYRFEHYIGVPLPVNYKFNIGQVNGFFVYAGPTLLFGLATVNLFKSPSQTRRGKEQEKFDVLLGGGVGYDLKDKFRFKLGLDWGFLDRSRDIQWHTEHTCQILLGVEYLF